MLCERFVKENLRLGNLAAASAVKDYARRSFRHHERQTRSRQESSLRSRGWQATDLYRIACLHLLLHECYVWNLGEIFNRLPVFSSCPFPWRNNRTVLSRQEMFYSNVVAFGNETGDRQLALRGSQLLACVMGLSSSFSASFVLRLGTKPFGFVSQRWRWYIIPKPCIYTVKIAQPSFVIKIVRHFNRSDQFSYRNTLLKM